jgi:sugar phosphate isomerase/epimerase
MPVPIAIQLYTVREALDKKFKDTVTRIAELGYAGIETAGYPAGVTVKEAARLFKDLGLTLCSAHVGMPIGDNVQKVLDEAAGTGCKRVITSTGRDGFKTADAIKATCDKLNEAAANVAKAGLAFGVHNHWWEFGRLADGTSAHKVMLQHMDPRVFFELDVYWIQTGGCNPAEIVAEFGKRASLLHIKDGPCEQGQPMTAVGDGKVDVPAVVKAAENNAEWLIVELDSCATDMMEAVARSYRYLAGNKLGRGSISL